MIPLQRLKLNPPSKMSWIDIPFKVREIIIDKMDAKTRCLFSRCSKICNEEAKKSKFYLYGLAVCEDQYYPVLLKIMYDESGNGYWFEFVRANTSQTIVVYRCSNAGKNTVMWTTLENGNNDEVTLRYLRNYLEIYKKQIQFFEFDVSSIQFSEFDSSESLDFTLRHLENLKKIKINDKPEEWRNLNDIPFVDKHQILNLEAIDLPDDFTFKSNDLFDFKGKNASVFIDDFDKDNCEQYLRMLKFGEITVDIIKIYAPALERTVFSNIVSEYAINEDNLISFDFCSDYRKYSVSFDEGVLNIRTIEVFKNEVDQCIFWNKLPWHIQENAIYQMDPKSRCRFAQCSKYSEKEAKRSKNYLYKIGVYKNLEWDTELHFAFSENSEKDFWFEFMSDYENDNQTIVLYKTWKNGEQFIKWTKVENGKPREVRLKYLKEYLSKYAKVIRYFHFEDETILLREFKANLNKLRNLEKIYVTDNTEKFPDYLKLGYLDWEVIRRCKHVFLHTDSVLSFEQLLELDIETAEFICVDMQEMDNFKNYLNMLKNGKIHENLKEIRFKFTNEEKMDIHEIGPLLRIEETPITLKFSLKSNVKENGIIEVFQQFGDDEYYISIKCYEESQV